MCASDPVDSAGDPVSEAVAKKAAAPVLKAVGQDDAKLDASQVMGAQRVVNADPVVGGLPTYGWTTGVTVSAQGEVVGGNGQLKTPVKGDTYPVLSAEKTLGLMNAAPTGPTTAWASAAAPSPVPLKDRLEAPCGGSRAGSPPGVRRRADGRAGHGHGREGACSGWPSHLVDGRQALVPSWLFEVRAAGAQDAFTVTYPAVDPKYLASTTPSAPSGPRPRRVTSPTLRAGPAGRHRWTATRPRAYELTVSFTGGVCADYDGEGEREVGRGDGHGDRRRPGRTRSAS